MIFLFHILRVINKNQRFLFVTYPQFKNILITNLQNNIAYKYDKTTKNFIAVDKTWLCQYY